MDKMPITDGCRQLAMHHFFAPDGGKERSSRMTG